MKPIRTGIVSVLQADAGVQALLGTAPPIYHSPAPTDAAMPYVTFAQQPGGRREWTYQVQAMRVSVWLVKGVAEKKADADDLDAACEAALNDAAMDVSPFSLMVCRRQSDLAYAERDAGVVVHHSGGIYEIGVT